MDGISDDIRECTLRINTPHFTGSTCAGMSNITNGVVLNSVSGSCRGCMDTVIIIVCRIAQTVGNRSTNRIICYSLIVSGCTATDPDTTKECCSGTCYGDTTEIVIADYCYTR